MRKRPLPSLTRICINFLYIVSTTFIIAIV